MSTKPAKLSFWHGILRESIPWFPTVSQDKCIGCEFCSFQADVRQLLRDNQLVLVNEARL